MQNNGRTFSKDDLVGFISSNLEESSLPTLKGKWFASYFILNNDKSIIQFTYLGKPQEYIFSSIIKKNNFIFFDNYENCQEYCIQQNKIK